MRIIPTAGAHPPLAIRSTAPARFGARGFIAWGPHGANSSKIAGQISRRLCSIVARPLMMANGSDGACMPWPRHRIHPAQAGHSARVAGNGHGPAGYDRADARATATHRSRRQAAYTTRIPALSPSGGHPPADTLNSR